MLDNIRDQWPTLQDGTKDGLSLFSGDVFSPSVESSVTRGSHMVCLSFPLKYVIHLLILGPNHEWTCPRRISHGYLHPSSKIDWQCSSFVSKETTILISVCRNDNSDAFSPHVFALLGYPHLSKLIKDTTFVHPTNQVLTISLISSPTAMDIKQHHWHYNVSGTWALTRVSSIRAGWNSHRRHWIGGKVRHPQYWIPIILIITQGMDWHCLYVASSLRVQRHEKSWYLPFAASPWSRWRIQVRYYYRAYPFSVRRDGSPLRVTHLHICTRVPNVCIL